MTNHIMFAKCKTCGQPIKKGLGYRTMLYTVILKCPRCKREREFQVLDCIPTKDIESIEKKEKELTNCCLPLIIFISYLCLDGLNELDEIQFGKFGDVYDG